MTHSAKRITIYNRIILKCVTIEVKKETEIYIFTIYDMYFTHVTILSLILGAYTYMDYL